MPPAIKSYIKWMNCVVCKFYLQQLFVKPTGSVLFLQLLGDFLSFQVYLRVPRNSKRLTYCELYTSEGCR